MTSSATEDDQTISPADDSAFSIALRNKKSRGANLNPNPKGLLKCILAIVPEETNVVYIEE